MKRLKAMSNREWAKKHYPKEMNATGCPKILGLDNDCLQFNLCAECWRSPAKRNGKYIMKAVRE